jgi:adenylate kinase family enzyme
MVVGSGGAGKTTLARRLAEVTGLPLTHLDREFWNPGWVKTPTDEWHAKVTELASSDRWIIEGNYGGSAHLRLARADTVVFLDFGRLVCMRRALSREIRNWGTCAQAPGCPERFSAEFLRWIWDYPKQGRVRMLDAIAEHGPEAEVIGLRSDSEVEAFLAGAAS